MSGQMKILTKSSIAAIVAVATIAGATAVIREKQYGTMKSGEQSISSREMDNRERVLREIASMNPDERLEWHVRHGLPGVQLDNNARNHLDELVRNGVSIEKLLKVMGPGPLPVERAESFLAEIAEPEYLEKSLDFLIRGKFRMNMIRNSAEDLSVERLEQDVQAAREKITDRSFQDQVAWVFRTGVDESQLQIFSDTLDQARDVLANIKITDEIRNTLDQQIHEIEHAAFDQFVKTTLKNTVNVEKWRVLADRSASEINREGPEHQVVMLIMAGRSENDLSEILKVRNNTPVSDM